jgi:hypothetical protein
MINFGGGAAPILGIALIVGAAALYFVRTVRPELSRDYDIFFSAVALICGGILLFQGWRLDPLLFLGQFALAGSAAFFAFDNIRMRKITTEQAKRSAPPVRDEERPVSRVYRAELDELPYNDYGDESPASRRIRGTEDPRVNRPYDDYDSPRRRPASSRPSPERRLRGSEDYPSAGAPPRRSASRPPRPSSRYGDRPPEPVADSAVREPLAWDEGYARRPAGGEFRRPPMAAPEGEGPSRPPSPDGPTPRRSRRRPPAETPRDPGGSDPAYVDYQPLKPYPTPDVESY